MNTEDKCICRTFDINYDFERFVRYTGRSIYLGKVDYFLFWINSNINIDLNSIEVWNGPKVHNVYKKDNIPEIIYCCHNNFLMTKEQFFDFGYFILNKKTDLIPDYFKEIGFCTELSNLQINK